jgi:hypothetical protein
LTPGSIPIAWIRPLAAPYLRGYTSRAQRQGNLRGYWLSTALCAGEPARKSERAETSAPRSRAGFFVGYLVGAEHYEFLNPQLPECLVFAFVHPVGGRAHRRLVERPEALLRKTFEYIRWLTHRPPRFAFYANAPAAMVRHLSMQDWPRAKYEHFSRNFFIETLAWLVRSGLVRKLLAERAAGPSPRARPRAP